MQSATPIAPSPDGSPPSAVVSAGLAALARERTARRAAEALAARLEAENAEIAEQVRRLEHLNDELRKLLFGKKSEKLGADERQLSFDDLGTAVSDAGGEPAADEQDGEAEPRRRQRRSARPGARFPAHIERRVDVIEPDSTLCPCGCGCGEMAKIGEDRSERLDIVPARFLVIETVRPRYACNRCKGGGVVQAAAPASLIEGGLPTEGLLAHVLISKYGDHLPLYRQSQIYARLGLDLHRATLADWVGKASFHLRPVVDCLAADLKTSGKLGVDETTIRVLDPGRGRTKTGYMWTMVRDERPWSGADPPGVVYCYAPGRGGKHGEKLLEGFSGTAQVDGYSGYNRLRRSDRPGGALRLANCWSHARRGLKEIFDSSGSPIAKAGLQRIARLYAIEEKIRGEPPATRQAIRWTESAPLVNAFGVWLDEQRSRVSPRSRLGEKLTYIANQWDGLLVFLYDGRVEIDSNFVENRIRPLKLTAKNALFAGHDEGAAAWGRIASLIETCKMNRVEPHAWLKSTLEKIAAGHPQSKIHDLSGRALARAPLGGGFPALPFRLQGGITVPPWATFPAALPKIPYVGFSPVRLQASGTSQFGTEPSAGSSRSRPIPPYPRTDAAFAPPFDDASHRLMLRLCVRNRRLQHRHLSPEALAPAGLCCPGHHRLAASSASLDVSASFPGTAGYRRGL